MTHKHTPAPWIAEGVYVQSLYTPNDGGRLFYHMIANCNQPLVKPEQAMANARLIAAAPELLEALEKLIQWMGKALADDAFKNCVSPQKARYEFEKAIQIVAKAKGE